ncbi:hypothetical protein FOMG_19762 [Fusarium oxysporum f. sp. melonis 26406]|uniref:Uncharacterized protein n=1 Tax=Fusarium oxysporum f. sp. melonis 26406 TaxID=1089452 RepID=W9YV59_FUSOX|nr:hypothetical protein FOMG_19762 [Fusarium oxysporum f. sp. melonis 26406]
MVSGPSARERVKHQWCHSRSQGCSAKELHGLLGLD